MRFGVDFDQNVGTEVIWVEFTKQQKFRGIPPFSLKFLLLGAFRGSGPQKGLEITYIITDFARHAGDRRKQRFYMFYCILPDVTENHDFT